MLGAMNSPDTVTRLNAALQGRYRIEREIGEGGGGICGGWGGHSRAISHRA